MINPARRTSPAVAPRPAAPSKPKPALKVVDSFQPAATGKTSSADTGTAASPFAPWITALYQDNLHRAPTAAEMDKNSKLIAALTASGKTIFEAGAVLNFEMRISPEYQQVHPMGNWINTAFNDNLGRWATPKEIDQTEGLIKTLGAQGKNIFEAAGTVIALLKMNPEYKQAHPFGPWIDETFTKLLGHLPSADELRSTEKVIGDALAQGKNIFEAGAIVNFLIKIGPEYQAAHPFAPWIGEEFRSTLGRDPSDDEIASTEGVIGKALGEGKNIFEAGALVDFLIKLGPEYQNGAGNVRNRILDVAQREVGTVEASNNNDGDVAKYPGYFGRGPESYCANFVSYVLSNAGVPTDFFNTETMKNAWVNDGKWKGKNDPQPGDVVWFDWDGDGVTDHVGLVKGVNGDGSIHTIEGNTGGPGGQEGVWEKDRDLSLIVGFGSPN